MNAVNCAARNRAALALIVSKRNVGKAIACPRRNYNANNKSPATDVA
jgi:hypothetical protein